MKLTTSDARLRLCHRTLMNDSFETCEGSRCMAWRWARIAFNRYVICINREATREPVRPANVPASWVWLPHDDDRPAQWIEPDDEAMERSTGYCGLAGKPDHD